MSSGRGLCGVPLHPTVKTMESAAMRSASRMWSSHRGEATSLGQSEAESTLQDSEKLTVVTFGRAGVTFPGNRRERLVAARKKTTSQPKPSYHHGDLRRALIEA